MSTAAVIFILVLLYFHLRYAFAIRRRIHDYDGWTEKQKRVQFFLCLFIPLIWVIVVYYITKKITNDELKEGRVKAANKWGNNPGHWPTSAGSGGGGAQ